MSNNSYSDIDQSMTIHPITKEVGTKVDVQSVKQALINLLLTPPFKRGFNTEIGIGLDRYLFENITPITVHEIKTDIKQLIQNHEPRVEIHNILIDPQPDYNYIGISIIFNVLYSDVVESVDLKLKKVR